MRVFSEEEVVRLLPMAAAVGVVESAARALGEGRAENGARMRLRAGGAMLHVLAGALPGALGAKIYTSGKRGARFWALLFDDEGELLALFEADQLGRIRTGAASGVATKYMSRADSRTVGLIGCGNQARTQLEAVCAVRPIERVTVWNRTREKLDPFCAVMTRELGIPVVACASARAAVEAADVVVTMTSASTPVVEGAWLRAGTHVNAAGANRISAREVDSELVRRSAVIAVEDREQVTRESGALKIAHDEGVFRYEDAVTLGEIVAGKTPGRRDAAQITLFESLGIGAWDVAAARHVYDAAAGLS